MSIDLEKGNDHSKCCVPESDRVGVELSGAAIPDLKVRALTIG